MARRMRALRTVVFVLLLAAVGTCGPGRAPAAASPVAVAVPAAAPPVHRSGPQALGNPTDSQTLRLLFIGASVTEGWFASAPSRTYTSIVARDLSSRGRRVRTRILA